jgi:hypothetical protein
MYAREEHGGGVAGLKEQDKTGNCPLCGVKRFSVGRGCGGFDAVAGFDGGGGPDVARAGREKKAAERADGAGRVF